MYGHGDHNLSNSLVRDIAKMAMAELKENVHVVVYADFDASQNLFDSGERFPSGAHWVGIPGGGEEPIPLAEEAEQNFDDPEVLKRAVTKAFTNFPSRRRALILWDHGGAWNGGFGGDTQDGSVAQITPLALPAVAQAVREGLREAAVEEKLDIFSFDTCLLSGMEVIPEFRDLAEVYIADAEIDYGEGWNYAAFLSHLSAHPEASASDLGKTEVTLWDELHRASTTNDKLLRSHVALDMARYQVFEDAFTGFVDALLASSELSGMEFARAAYFTLPPYMNQLEDPTASPALRDAGSFLSRIAQLSSDEEVKLSAAAALEALDAAILGRSQGTLRDAAGQHGVHIELPLAATIHSDYLTLYAQYAPEFNRVSQWHDGLRVYGALNDGTEPSLVAALENGSAPSSEALPTLTFGSADLDVAEALIELASIVEPSAPDELLFFGVLAKGAIEPDAAYGVSWDGTLTTLPGADSELQPVYVRVWEDLGQDVATGEALAPLLAIFGAIQNGDTQTLGALLYQDGDTSTGLLAVFDPAISMPLSDVAVDLPGTTFSPILPGVSLSTQQSSLRLGTPIPLNRASLPVSRAPAAAGGYALLTTVTDVFGNSSVDSQFVVLSTPISLP